MKTLSLADCVIVVLSAKYLRSPFGMAELHGIYQRSVGEKKEFLRRIIPLVLADARFGTPGKRIEYAKYSLRWRAFNLSVRANEVRRLRVDSNLQQDLGDGGQNHADKELKIRMKESRLTALLNLICGLG
jgi:hypothetical protein